jgi:hypothetical protein
LLRSNLIQYNFGNLYSWWVCLWPGVDLHCRTQEFVGSAGGSRPSTECPVGSVDVEFTARLPRRLCFH